jgi:NAD(P)-dependent dehydrogenase (short-subunit alcohol dehydrogenase family)
VIRNMRSSPPRVDRAERLDQSLSRHSKAELLSPAETLPRELIGRGICANVISPDPIFTALCSKHSLSETELDATKRACLTQFRPVRRG